MAESLIADEEQRKHQKPQLAKENALALIDDLFGFELVKDKVKQLESYEDVNLYLRTVDGSQYIFKTHNGVESDKRDFLVGTNELLLHLREHGIVAPYPVNNKSGEWLSTVSLPLRSGEPKTHAVRLLEYVEGEMLNAHEVTPELMLSAGAYLGSLDKVLDKFDHEGFHRLHAWDLRQTSMLASFYKYLDEQWRLDLVQGVVSDFENQILPVSSEFRMGLCQGDFNDANIIVARGEDGKVGPTGVIDFGDSVHTWRVNDLAIAMAYVMICLSNPENKRAGFEEFGQVDSLVAAAHFLVGFESIYPLLPTERAMVWKLASCRLATSGTMGWYAWAMDPSNEYLKYHAKPAWEALKVVRNTTDEEIQATVDAAARSRSTS
eukprot:TRINITY_DN2164_c0_g2_i1.p1 TRINITY_DN2164_c0_g2~~TRINITY_DN2164_c0_g2_i1.p1  ORF type:complete len:378 (+),score=60.08 TRINITY_DN2164_c0_g2_i1:72-1205(+)